VVGGFYDQQYLLPRMAGQYVFIGFTANPAEAGQWFLDGTKVDSVALLGYRWSGTDSSSSYTFLVYPGQYGLEPFVCSIGATDKMLSCRYETGGNTLTVFEACYTSIDGLNKDVLSLSTYYGMCYVENPGPPFSFKAVPIPN
jgi:hypothetical protein